MFLLKNSARSQSPAANSGKRGGATFSFPIGRLVLNPGPAGSCGCVSVRRSLMEAATLLASGKFERFDRRLCFAGCIVS